MTKASCSSYTNIPGSHPSPARVRPVPVAAPKPGERRTKDKIKFCRQFSWDHSGTGMCIGIRFMSRRFPANVDLPRCAPHSHSLSTRTDFVPSSETLHSPQVSYLIPVLRLAATLATDGRDHMKLMDVLIRVMAPVIFTVRQEGKEPSPSEGRETHQRRSLVSL